MGVPRSLDSGSVDTHVVHGSTPRAGADGSRVVLHVAGYGRTMRTLPLGGPKSGAVDLSPIPRLPRTAEPRLPWLWCSPRVAVRLVAGFVLLFLTGFALAGVLADATPVWSEEDAAAGSGSGELATGGLSPRAGAIDPDDTGLDARVATTLAETRPAWVVALAGLFAGLAKIWVVGPLAAVIGLLVWRRTGRVTAFWVPALAGGGGFALSVAVKFATYRPRPPEEVAVVEAFGPSYPSGHVIRAIAVYGALAWFVAVTSRSVMRARLAWTTAAGLTLTIGASRVVEGAHWLTDVVASLVLGGGWLLVVLAASGLLALPEQRR